MATSTEILRILLTGDSRGLVAAFKDAGTAAEKMSVVGSAATRSLTLPLVAVGVAAVGMASDMAEAGAKVDQVFGSAAETVEEFAKTTSEAFGISESAALAAAGTIGNLIVSLGGTQEAAAEMSIELVSLAGDLASFNNIGSDEALEKLRSGLVGEVEPLRALGVSFNAAQVQAEALNVALADGREEITESDKVTARYRLILEQTGTAQGDFARTSDGLANQQRIAQARMQDSAAAIGQVLLPAAAAATGVIADLAGKFSELPEATQRTVVGVGVLVAAMGPALSIAGSVATNFTKLKGSLTALGGARAGAIGAAALGVAALAYYLNAAAEDAAQLDAAADSLAEATERTGSSATALAEYLNGVSSEAELMRGLMRDAGLTIGDVVAYVEQGADGFSSLRAELVSSGAQIDSVNLAFSFLEDVVAETNDQLAASAAVQHDLALATYEDSAAFLEVEAAIAAAGAAAGEAVPPSEELLAAAAGLADEWDAAAVAADAFQSVLDDLVGGALNLSDAYDEAIGAVQGIGEAIDDTTQSLDQNSAAGLANRDAIRDGVQAGLDLANAMVREGSSLAEAEGALNSHIAALREQYIAIGGNAEQFDLLVASINATPDAVATAVDLTGVEAGQAQVEEFQRLIDGLPDEEQVEFQALLDSGNIPGLVEAFRRIGLDVSAGLAAGIDSGRGVALAAAQRLIDATSAAAAEQAGIRSPSRLFAIAIGRPITEGIAAGMLEATDSVVSAVDELYQELEGRLFDHLSEFQSGVAAFFGSGVAAVNLDDARAKLAELQAEQATGGGVAGAQAAVDQARAAFDRAQGTRHEADAKKTLEAAQKDLDAARERSEDLPGLIADAERDLTQAQLASVRAQQQLIETGSELIGQGPEAEHNFRQLATAAGLQADEIERLVAAQRAAITVASQAGLQAETFPGAGAQDLVAIGQQAIERNQLYGVYRYNVANSAVGAAIEAQVGDDEGAYNSLLDQVTTAYRDLTEAVGEDMAASLAGRGDISPEQFIEAARAIIARSPRRGYGGTATAGMPIVVGDRGPELFIPGANGTISPGTGGTVMNITIMPPPGVNGEEIAAALNRWYRQGGSAPWATSKRG